jgi:formylmethanofuran dehydrogenase subunit E
VVALVARAPVSEYLDRLAGMHPRVCPRQVLGVRMGLLVPSLLQLDISRDDKRLLAIVETDGCFADGISVATGCWLGRRTLRLEDFGKVAVTFVDTVTERAVRMWPHESARTSAAYYAPEAANRWQAQLLGYQRMPAEELLRAASVKLVEPVGSIGREPATRQQCDTCGEEIINQREVPGHHAFECRSCAIGAYYVEL